MNSSDLVILSVLFNIVQFIVIVILFMKFSKYRDAIHKIDGIVSGLKKEKPAPPDPRRRIKNRIKEP